MITNGSHEHPSEVADRELKYRFPIRCCILGIAILFVAVVISRWTILAISGANSWVLGMEVVVSILRWAVLAGIVLIGQAIAYRLLHGRIQGTAIWAALFLLPSVVLGASSVYRSLQMGAAVRRANEPMAKATRILKYGRLAALPASATDVRVYNWSTPFSGEWYLHFRTSPEEIDRFLTESPSLRAQTCETYSPQRMRPPESLRPRTPDSVGSSRHTYFTPHSRAPEWFDTEIRERGRGYTIPPEGYHNWGEVIVNDEEHVVYVKVVWS